MKIVIATHKKDFWFCRICAASVRYYYPDIDILIIKDEMNGKFNTAELEKRWDVRQVDLGQKKFGWSASKIIFLLQAEKGEKYLMLDSDIVFAGPFLERLARKTAENDMVVNAAFLEDPMTKEAWVKNIYFDFKKVKESDNEYEYPGYFFNAGQLFVTGGSIRREDLAGLFDPDAYPYYKNLDLFPIVDQSIYNYMFPKLQKKGGLTVATDAYMWWSGVESLSQVSLEDIKEKRIDFGLIHWAGELRVPMLSKMTRSDLLIFFENYYYSRIPFGRLKQAARKIIPALQYLFTKEKSKLIK